MWCEGRGGERNPFRCFFVGNQGNLTSNKTTLLTNTVTRFHHTSTSHWCSCSKTINDEKYQDPFQLGKKDLKNLYEDIKKVRDFGDCAGMSR